MRAFMDELHIIRLDGKRWNEWLIYTQLKHACKLHPPIHLSFLISFHSYNADLFTLPLWRGHLPTRSDANDSGLRLAVAKLGL